MSIFGTSNAYDSDRKLMESLGLRTYNFDRGWTDLGTVTLDWDGSDDKRPKATIKVDVSSMPAQFWKFTITRPNEDNYENDYLPLEVFELQTGSGNFHEYWPLAKMVADQMVDIKQIEEV